MKQIELNGIWQAKIDPEDCGLAEGWAAAPLTDTMALQVPGCIQQLDCLAEAYPPQKDMRNDYLGTFFLEKKVVLPQLAERERCRLVLGGVLPCGDIWVNGRYVARHFYCVCAARVDITAYVQPGEENRITVAVTENHAGLSTGMRFAGRSWSGIYSRACIEIGAAVYMEDVYISNPEQDRAVIRGVLVNDGCQPFEGRVSAEIDGRQAEKAAAVPAYSRAELAWEIDVKGLERWAPRHPRLHELSLAIFQDDEELDRTVVSVGLRRLTAEGRNVCLDGRPVYLAGCGAEYYSPSISPLVDEKLIRRRFQAMLDHGFRFYRYHTHVPTEEEMAVADEMGMLLDVEFGLISNFNKTTPFEEGVEMLECYVRQTRRHPSVILYCLGNEGSQLMVDSQAECQRARIGYDAIKRNTTEQLALIAFGMQGELPELPNDLETPHLWSDNFLWGYDGLTDIPWETVEETTHGKPCVIHEYGKFGVWPDIREEAAYPNKGSRPDFGRQARQALEELGMTEMEAQLIRTSRELSGVCNRVILEEARRQPYVCGYALWLFFRRADANGGLCGDTGSYYDQDPALFRRGCNADVALLMDRGFRGRSLTCGLAEQLELTVSNYGDKDIREAVLEWRLEAGEELIDAGVLKSIHRNQGTTDTVGRICLQVPRAQDGQKLLLSVVLRDQTGILSENAWDFWAFDPTPDQEIRAYLHVEDLTARRAIQQALPKARILSSVDSVIRGCRSWRGSAEAQTAIQDGKTLVIADRFDDTVKRCFENGVRVLLLDSGSLPEEWLTPPLCDDLGERDTSRFYSSFRAGWDKGNLLTFIQTDPLLEGFPHGDFCDLQFYELVQGARPLCPAALEKEFAAHPVRVIGGVTKIQSAAKADTLVQDPNAIKELLALQRRSFFAREQGYLMNIRENGNQLAVCTLRLTDNLAGISAMKTIVKNLQRS